MKTRTIYSEKELITNINTIESNDNLIVMKKASNIDGRKITYKIIKRFFDIIFSLIGVVGIIPIAIILKISYILSGDYKTIFYKQKRIGKNGKTIYIYKFRTMVYNADDVLKEMLKEKKYKEQWNKYQKIENDPRITKIGKILRKTSLDEFPQFFNVYCA